MPGFFNLPVARRKLGNYHGPILGRIPILKAFIRKQYIPIQMLSIHSDEYFMGKAMEEARKANHSGEVPIGAIVVCQNQIIAKGYNQTERLKDISAHAEIIAITAAANYLNAKYLIDCTLYVTLEPCVMCAGALYWSQLGRLVYGASDEKRGFMRFGKALLHPKTIVEMGIMEKECEEYLKGFFKGLR